ncbi:MAG: hypothetical protein ACOC5C_01755 [Halobacteriota archaeon]
MHETSSTREWLPGDNGLLKKHPYCVRCGTVKNISSDRGKKTGYFVNVIHSIKEHMERKDYIVTQAHTRLIIKEFEERGLGDSYSLRYSTQRKVFTELVKKYLRVSEDTVKNFL